MTPAGPAGPVDPLAVFVGAHRDSLPRARATRRFNSGEHLWLASRGAEAACEQLSREGAPDFRDLFVGISRRHGQDQLDYGELVALAGDFYETPEELFEEKPSSAPWLLGGNDLGDLRDIFSAELRWIEDRQMGLAGPVYPDNNVRFWWNAKSYVELALQNDDHFGWHNMLAYCRHHEAALDFALAAEGREEESLRRALYTNAFADHFLTDGFAAGHIRVPRTEIREWGKEMGYSEKLAGALSKVLHDQDGHVDESSLHGNVNENDRPPTDGLKVRNSGDVSWYSRCDGQLFLYPASLGSVAVAQAVAAVAASVGELLEAWQRRTLPAGAYRATQFVPFPHPQTPRLVERFPANMADGAFDALLASVAWYTKVPWISGLGAAELRALLAALPELMARFRAGVKRDVQHEPAVRNRVAALYVEAYSEIG